MKVKNIVFFGFAAAILSGVANADPLQVASTAYVNAQLSGKANSADLAEVATTGAYSDLSGTPDLTVYATTSAMNTALEAKADSADLADYATTQAMNTALAAKANSADLAEVATTGAYSDLSGTPDLTVYATTSAMNTALEAKADSADLADYATTQAMNTALQAKANSADLAEVATSGSYNDLEDKPQIPAAQVQSDWTATEGMGVILHKPTLSNVATSGAYSDLSGTPDLTVYATTQAMNTALADYTTTADLNTALAAKANANIIGSGFDTTNTVAAALADKADDSDLTALETRVETAEGKIGTGNMSVGGAQQSTIIAAINALDTKTNGIATQGNLETLESSVTALSNTVGSASGGLVKDVADNTDAISDIQTDLAGKADAATTLAGYGITDAYTKTQVDNALAAILPASNTCTSSSGHCVLSIDKTTGALSWVDVTTPWVTIE